jgi:hexosaminidase
MSGHGLAIAGLSVICVILVLVVVVLALVATPSRIVTRGGDRPGRSVFDTILSSMSSSVNGKTREVPRCRAAGLGAEAVPGPGFRPDLDSVKLAPQRVWPYPNSIHVGGSASDRVRVGALLREDVDRRVATVVIDDFNAFTQLGDGKGSHDGRPRLHIQVKVGFGPEDMGDDSYVLTVTREQVMVEAPTYVGAVYGLQTLQQLVRGSAGEIAHVPLTIKDSPRVPFRALMLDCARHFLPVDVLKTQIRAMAFQKLNFLHLHLTDGQSFPVAVGPATAAIARGNYNGNTGAFGPHETYSAGDIAEVLELARAYGVKVIPEIDTPGHAYSWICGHPDIMACAGPGDQYQAVCPEPPCGFLNLRDKLDRVKAVVQEVLAEVKAAFRVGQPGYSPYLHLGFDEVGCPSRGPGGVCTKPSCVEAFGGVSVTYGNWLLGWAKSNRIRVMMWVDQILTSNFDAAGKYSPVLAVDPALVTLQFWNLDAATPGRLAALAAQGFSLVNSQSTVYYLDAGGEGNGVFWGGTIKSKSASAPVSPAPVSPAPASAPAATVGYQKYWMATYPGVTGLLPNGWPTSWEDIYQNNPALLPTSIGSGTDGTAGYQAVPMAKTLHAPGIVGVAVCAWGEQIDETNVDTRVWPKTAALAEALWRHSPDRLPDTIPNARLRIAYAREDLLRLGVRAAPIVAGDMFRQAPWGPLGPGSGTSLMYDINSAVPQRPNGYILTFKRWWGAASACTAPVNPYCGDAVSGTVSCTDPKAAPYPQQGCPP